MSAFGAPMDDEKYRVSLSNAVYDQPRDGFVMVRVEDARWLLSQYERRRAIEKSLKDIYRTVDVAKQDFPL